MQRKFLVRKGLCSQPPTTPIFQTISLDIALDLKILRMSDAVCDEEEMTEYSWTIVYD